VKKLAVSAVIIGVFLVYSLMHARASVGFAPSQASNDSPSTSGSSTSTTQNGGTPVAGSRYKDGSYTGGAADAQWGYIQVKIAIKGGNLTNVQFVQYPNHRSRSVEINNYAMPQLTSEAIQAQSAQVDAISGATDTSEAFIQSLGDALSQAS
jgi:uncharacterized protein with FMN-binding domain